MFVLILLVSFFALSCSKEPPLSADRAGKATDLDDMFDAFRQSQSDDEPAATADTSQTAASDDEGENVPESSEEENVGETVTESSGSPESDRAALEEFYQHLLEGVAPSSGHIEELTEHNWMSRSTIAKWRGITVDEEGRVVEISLNGWALWRNSNKLIPEEAFAALARLDRLRRLDLPSCILAIQPEKFDNLQQLEYLNLDGNFFPEESDYESLCNLSNLGYLSMRAVNLNPLIECIDNLTQLEHLHLERDYLQFRGIWPFDFEFTCIGCVNFEQGTFVDTVKGVPLDTLLLSSVGNLHNLRYLRLKNMGFTGIPPWIGQLTNLEEFDVRGDEFGGHPFIGPLPAELGQLHNLKRLSISASGPLPAEIGQMESLEELQITGPYTASGARRAQEEGYDLKEDLSQIRTLYTYRGYTAEQIEALPSLDGPLPPEWGQLSNLKSLRLYGYLSGSLPPEWGQMTSLEELRLSDLELSGPIPPEWVNLTSLKEFYAKNNILSGPLPDDMGKMHSLEKLDLSHNEITGPLPSLRGLGNLEWLILNGNLLSGPLPDLSGLRSLEWLYLSDNQLSGSVPSPFPSLGNVSILFLNHNQFTGPWPNIRGLSSLRSFGLRAGNDLDYIGCIPRNLVPPQFDSCVLDRLHLELAVCRDGRC